MQTTKFLKEFGTAILVIGIIGGIVLIFINTILGVGSIILSVFWWTLCNWLSEILENSYKKISLLYELRNKLDGIKDKL